MNLSAKIFRSSAILQQHAGLRSISGPEWDAALADATLLRIAESTPVSRLCKQPSEHFTIVVKGEIKVQSVSEDGRTYCLYRVKAGKLCILSFTAIVMPQREILLMSGEGEVQLLRIPKTHMEPLLAHSDTFRRYLLACMATHSNKLFDRIEAATFSCLKSRILDHLRTVCASTGQSTITISHLELAEELGSTREAVSRTLKEMERLGQVALGRRSIAVANDNMVFLYRPGSSTPIAM
jgi:CRP/FNR family transcriptional regulator